jgi:hypothetical protein
MQSKKRKSSKSSGNQDVYGVGDYEVSFSSSFMQNSLKVIEISTDLADYIENGGNFELKGHQDRKNVILCSDTLAYEVKRIENSNTILLAKQETNQLVIVDKKTDLYELSETSPRLTQIHELLKPFQLNQNEFNEAIGLHPQTLFSEVQASKHQIQAALHDVGAVEVNGKYHLLSSFFRYKLVRRLLDAILENSWDLSDVNENLCCKELSDINPAFVTSILYILGKRDSTKTTRWMLDFDRIAIASAHNLFLSNQVS